MCARVSLFVSVCFFRRCDSLCCVCIHTHWFGFVVQFSFHFHVSVFINSRCVLVFLSSVSFSWRALVLLYLLTCLLSCFFLLVVVLLFPMLLFLLLILFFACKNIFSLYCFIHPPTSPIHTFSPFPAFPNSFFPSISDY